MAKHAWIFLAAISLGVMTSWSLSHIRPTRLEDEGPLKPIGIEGYWHATWRHATPWPGVVAEYWTWWEDERPTTYSKTRFVQAEIADESPFSAYGLAVQGYRPWVRNVGWAVFLLLTALALKVQRDSKRLTEGENEESEPSENEPVKPTRLYLVPSECDHSGARMTAQCLMED